MQVINTGHHSEDVLLVLYGTIDHQTTRPKAYLVSVMVYRHKYTWCKICKGEKKRRHVYRVSCIRILDYRGSKLEAQMTLGHVYVVHHSNFTYNIVTEIKRALHNRVLLPHLFSSQDYGG